MCQPRVDRSVGSPSLEDSDIRIEKMELEGKRQEEPDFHKVVSNSLCANGWFLQKGVAQPKEKVIKGKWK